MTISSFLIYDRQSTNHTIYSCLHYICYAHWHHQTLAQGPFCASTFVIVCIQLLRLSQPSIKRPLLSSSPYLHVVKLAPLSCFAGSISLIKLLRTALSLSALYRKTHTLSSSSLSSSGAARSCQGSTSLPSCLIKSISRSNSGCGALASALSQAHFIKFSCKFNMLSPSLNLPSSGWFSCLTRCS
jgi:hypothetical protein